MSSSGSLIASGAAARFGGELPAGCDPELPAAASIPPDVLLFSHGRAALAWLVARRGPFASALLCAYTCPTVPRALARLGLALAFFDHGVTDIAPHARALPGRTLVLVPATFGMAPWLDAAALARALGEAAMVVIDAAQTGFGHLDYAPPGAGAVLACPRKALALGDGAALRLEEVSDDDREAVADLPEAREASALKQKGRKLFAGGDPARENEALALVRAAEDAYPDTPHRMSADSRALFERIDPREHARRRRENARALEAALGGLGPSLLAGEATPFTYPVLVRKRARLLARLHAARVFATPLWHDARHEPARHPVAARFAQELLGLPVDQRYDPRDMAGLAERVRACL